MLSCLQPFKRYYTKNLRSLNHFKTTPSLYIERDSGGSKRQRNYYSNAFGGGLTLVIYILIVVYALSVANEMYDHDLDTITKVDYYNPTSGHFISLRDMCLASNDLNIGNELSVREFRSEGMPQFLSWRCKASSKCQNINKDSFKFKMLYSGNGEFKEVSTNFKDLYELPEGDLKLRPNQYFEIDIALDSSANLAAGEEVELVYKNTYLLENNKKRLSVVQSDGVLFTFSSFAKQYDLRTSIDITNSEEKLSRWNLFSKSTRRGYHFKEAQVSSSL
jgi:hypothetical protein